MNYRFVDGAFEPQDGKRAVAEVERMFETMNFGIIRHSPTGELATPGYPDGDELVADYYTTLALVHNEGSGPWEVLTTNIRRMHIGGLRHLHVTVIMRHLRYPDRVIHAYYFAEGGEQK